MNRWCKIGCTLDILRQRGEVLITLPEKEELIFTIETDDPYGVEAYWHRRFNRLRAQREWFGLKPADVKALKKWKKIF